MGLVEIMVSLTIGLVIIAALVALFVGTSRNNRQMATANSMIENGRFAIQLLEEDVIHAGYWGQFVPEFDDQTQGHDRAGGRADGPAGSLPRLRQLGRGLPATTCSASRCRPTTRPPICSGDRD